MSVTVRIVKGPSEAFVYLEGSVEGFPQVTRRRSVSCAALAGGRVTVAGERAALVTEVESALINWQAAQAALQELE